MALSSSFWQDVSTSNSHKKCKLFYAKINNASLGLGGRQIESRDQQIFHFQLQKKIIIFCFCVFFAFFSWNSHGMPHAYDRNCLNTRRIGNTHWGSRSAQRCLWIKECHAHTHMSIQWPFRAKEMAYPHPADPLSKLMRFVLNRIQIVF